ncbi:hypothetical protein E4U60_000859 [Claviceps pazoutovae]|uniref:Genetic interactor of prohibitins 3, mitochondrial n=1 Tax=Claviceps pazoutovae TaxID=1649127 RepID=A0A9P7SKW3_9HYPO|nr:hypothetical protein E4U60_000859 [Claviceps pazoutovae]
MNRVATARSLGRALRIGDASSASGVPIFLCPAIGRVRAGGRRLNIAKSTPRRFNHTNSANVAAPVPSTPSDADKTLVDVSKTSARTLPVTCSGCGAFSQTADAQQLGYFNLQRKKVQQWLKPQNDKDSDGRRLRKAAAEEDEIVGNILKNMPSEELKALGLSAETMLREEQAAVANPVAENPPVCDRCHDLIYYSTTKDTAKVPMPHPTVESLRETIEESPYRYNHIYHIIDAADFPMSLIPQLNVLLGGKNLRTKNRRSRPEKPYSNQQIEMSFIITRSDLLGPTKQIVDSKMPYLREVLREALGRFGSRVRLGNVSCVSARRVWWTKELREEVWNRGGGGWMVGKVNVGKSQLFEHIFPKGRMSEDGGEDQADAVSGETGRGKKIQQDLDLDELLPPAQPATNYPPMPLVSPLPGTTASPIRVPFGNGKGELIDLPGLARSDLELYVKEEDRETLVMQRRIVPEQRTLKSSRSLILGGGLIRITPRTPGLIFLMYNFTPLKDHVTLTDKAIAFSENTRVSIGVPSILSPDVNEYTSKHAGRFKVSYDVTKASSGPLTRKNAVAIPVERLHFRVLSVDILIEGVGFVEITVQVRRHQYNKWMQMQEERDKAIAALREAGVSTAGIDGAAGPRSSPDSADDSSASASDMEVSQDAFDVMIQNRRDAVAVHPASEADMAELPPEPDWPVVDVFSPEGKFVGSRRPIEGWESNKPPPQVNAYQKKTKARQRRLRLEA